MMPGMIRVGHIRGRAMAAAGAEPTRAAAEAKKRYMISIPRVKSPRILARNPGVTIAMIRVRTLLPGDTAHDALE